MNNRTKPSSELELVGLLEAGLSALGQGPRWLLEVRSHGRARTDLVANVGDDLIGIEVKLSDWQGAIRQAALNRFCFDRSYVALWTTSITETVSESAQKHGVGIIAVNHEDVTIAYPAPRANPVQTIRTRLLKQLDRESP